MIIGVDEVGRGAWAGPVVVGAVGLRIPITGLNDSKKLGLKQRQKLSKIIYQNAEFVGIGWASSSEVDDYGLDAALTLASLRALRNIDEESEIIIDGNRNFLPTNYRNVETIIKADSSVPEVSAASIVAKVSRDNYMKQISDKFPDYAFDLNVGYGTKKHSDGIIKNGLCGEHRLSFKPIAGFLNGYS